MYILIFKYIFTFLKYNQKYIDIKQKKYYHFISVNEVHIFLITYDVNLLQTFIFQMLLKLSLYRFTKYKGYNGFTSV